MKIESISEIDKFILMRTLGFKAKHSMEDIDFILKQNVKDYSINLETGEVTIALVKPIKETSVFIDFEI